MEAIMAIIKIVAEGVAITKEIQELAKRVNAGEEITNDEIKEALSSAGKELENFLE